jgi:hypothetical protein
MIWLVMTPVVGACFIMGTFGSSCCGVEIDARQVLLLRQYSLKRAVVRGGDGEKGPEMNDPEKGIKDESNAALDQASVLTSGADEDDEEAKTVEGRPPTEITKDYEQEL